jgi:hypothetical protein
MDHVEQPQPAGSTALDAARRGFREDLHPGRRSAVVSWLAFSSTFAAVRAVTYSIRDGRGPFRNLTPGGMHLHHYLWGILLVTAVGGVAIRGDDRLRHHPVVAAAYGVGGALIVDEFALLLDLRDVYWASDGRWSVDLGVGLAATAGLLLEGAPVIGRVRRHLAGKAG